MCQPVLVLPHLAHNCTPVLATCSFCIPVGITAALMNKFATCSVMYLDVRWVFGDTAKQINFW